jgi:hypothetical protein
MTGMVTGNKIGGLLGLGKRKRLMMGYGFE